MEHTLRLSIPPLSTIDYGQSENLRLDLEREVGPTEWVRTKAPDGAKSAQELLQAGTIVVSILGTPALVALVSVLKSYIERDRTIEINIEGSGGTTTLKLPESSRLTTGEIQRIIESVLDRN